MPQYVFINGERMELLEDRRFAMFPRFTEGTELYDPSTPPSRIVPLSTDSEDLGVTTRKLVPNRHYFARTVEGTPATMGVKHLIVHNVPVNITARDLGQFFESYSGVHEADIMRWPGGNASPVYSKGRGYVTLHSEAAMTMLAKERTLYFDPMDTYLFIEGTDRQPSHMTHANTHFQPPPLPPPTYDQGGAPPQPPVGGSGVPGPRSLQQQQLPPQRGGAMQQPHQGGHQQHGHHPQQQQGPQGHYEHRRGPTGNSELVNTYYFVDKMSEDYASYSHNNGVFWPNLGNRREYLQAASKGTVYVCFLLLVRNEPHLYGYTRIVWPQPQTEGTRLRGEVAIEWIAFGTMLERATLHQRLNVNVCGMSEGTPVKPELGQSIAELIDVSPQTAVLPRGRNSPPPNANSRDVDQGGQPPHSNPNVVAPRSAGLQQQGQQGNHQHHGHNQQGGHHQQQHHGGGPHQQMHHQQQQGGHPQAAPMMNNAVKKNIIPPATQQQQGHGQGVSGAPLHNHHHNSGSHQHSNQPHQNVPSAGNHVPPKRSVAPPLPRNYNNHSGGSGYTGTGSGPPAVPLPASVAAAQARAAAAAAKPAEANNDANVPTPASVQKQPSAAEVKAPKQEESKPVAPKQAAAPASAKPKKEEPKEDYPALPGM